ncbi:hypothetical protein [uncultured Ruminococcus sp.]|uniref:hypothetical protein n=1 Tax=uncultured Ruminococcus sp. TaxID=165186 RepID=UPI0025F49D01|nr:hypothetical protein [uncultured Ruminococcus sp.]
MKLSVLLITGSSDRVALETVENIASQSGELTKDIFLIIAGDFNEEDRKKLYLERSAAYGMTAFINVGEKSEAELLNTFVRFSNAEYCTVMRAGAKADPSYFPRLTAALDDDKELNFACGRRLAANKEQLKRELTLQKGILDLDKVFCAFPDSLEGVCARTSYLAEHPFETEAGTFAEQKNMLAMLNDCRRIWYDSTLKVLQADCNKNYADAESFPPDAMTAKWHTAIFENCILPTEEKCKGKDGRLPLFLQHYAATEVLRRIDYGRLLTNFPENERETVIKTLTKALAPVEDKVLCGIYADDLPHCTVSDKRIILGLKHGREDYYTDLSYSRDKLFAVQKDIVIADSTAAEIRIDLINHRKDMTEIDGRFDDIFNHRRTKLIAEYAGKEYTITYDSKFVKHFFFGREISVEKSFHLTFPLSGTRAELRFFLLFKGCRYEIKQRCSGQQSAKLLDDRYDSFIRLTNDICITSEGGRLVTQPMTISEQRRRFGKAVSRSAERGVPFFLRTGDRIAHRWAEGRKIWIFADDPEIGGGAAEDMFRYAMTRHDEIYCYYLTERESPAAERLIKDGYKPLYTDSFLHKLLFLNAQVYITTRPRADRTNFCCMTEAQGTLGRCSRMNVIMLQNSPDDMPAVSENNRLCDNVRLYFCGTKKYTDELKKPEYGYDNTDILRLTGLTCYDGIKDTSGEEKLLLMLAHYKAEDNADFKDTEFFRNIRTLLENRRFTDALTDSGYTLTVALGGVKNEDAEDLPKHDRITVLTDDVDEDELKSRAALIVTDNGEEISAGIMRKPLIYFGGEGGYDFGERAESAYRLADLLCGHLKDGVHQSEEKTRAADEFFGRAELGYKREIYNEIITWLCENGEIDSYEDFEVADSYEDED